MFAPHHQSHLAEIYLRELREVSGKVALWAAALLDDGMTIAQVRGLLKELAGK